MSRTVRETGHMGATVTAKPKIIQVSRTSDRDHGYLSRREPVLGLRSSPRTTSHIGVENMRQIRSSVRNVMAFPASTFCQYRTEYPCESMSSWLSPASSRKRLIRAPKPLKNWDSSPLCPFCKLLALKGTRPIWRRGIFSTGVAEWPKEGGNHTSGN